MKIMERHSGVVSYATGTGLFGLGALSADDINVIAMIVGILTGVGTFLVNWYYKRKEDKRNEQRCKSTD